MIPRKLVLRNFMCYRDDVPPLDLDGWLRDPWQELSPHLLRNRTGIATSYALLSDTGSALVVDWGYDFWTGIPLGGERAANRPLLASIESLHRDHGVHPLAAECFPSPA